MIFEPKPTLQISSRTWAVMIALAVTGQIAWAVENTWFNAFVLIRRFGIPTTLNGQAEFIPVRQIFQVGAILGLFALIPLAFIRSDKMHHMNEEQNA